MKKISFICTANICRSPMAQGIAEHLLNPEDFEISSAGIMDFSGAPAAWLATAICAEKGTPIDQHISSFIEDIDLSPDTEYFVMEERHKEALLELDSNVQVTLLATLDPNDVPQEISDPIGGTPEDFSACYDQLTRCIAALKKRAG